MSPRPRPLLASVILLVLWSSAPAHGAEVPDGVSSVISDHTLLVTAGSHSSLTIQGSPGVGSGPRITCGWFGLDTSTVDIDVYQLNDPEIGHTYLLWCWYAEEAESLPGHPVVTTYDGPGVPGEPDDIDEVSDFALASMDFAEPDPVVSPPDTQVVGVETWLAVTSALEYDAVHASAGPVWASVQPRFREVIWRFETGEAVHCTIPSDATTVWDPLRPDATSGCTHTFEDSGDGHQEVTTTVVWTVMRRTFEHDNWLPWRDFSLTTTRTLPVLDLQAAIH